MPPSRNQAWTSVEIAHRSKLPISPISPNANQSKLPVQFAHRSAALVMRSSPPSPPCRRPPSPQPRTHSLAHHLLSRASCSLLGMARHGLLHPLAPPRLAHDSAAAARPPTTSSLVLPRAHGRLHEHARGTPALPTHAGMSAPSRAFLSTRVGRRRCRRVCQRSQRRSYRRSNRRSRRRHIAHTVSPHVRRRCVQLATTPLNYRRRVAEGIRFQRQKG